MTAHAHRMAIYLKCPHPTIIDGEMRWDSGWFLVGFGVGGQHLTRNLSQSDYSILVALKY